MIAILNGVIKYKQPEQIVLLTGGVGYRVFVSLHTFYELPPLGEETTLYIHTIVREDAFHLYGFSREEERQTFNKLISISGVGPKVAMGMLSGITPQELWHAVKARNIDRLTRIPGIGKKTAARLVVELEGKLPQDAHDGMDADTMPGSVEADALSALVNLGYPEAAARKAIKAAVAEIDDNASLQQILKASLLHLGGTRK